MNYVHKKVYNYYLLQLNLQLISKKYMIYEINVHNAICISKVIIAKNLKNWRRSLLVVLVR